MLRDKFKAGSQGAAAVMESLDSARLRIEAMTEEEQKEKAKDYGRLQDLLDVKYNMTSPPRHNWRAPHQWATRARRPSAGAHRQGYPLDVSTPFPAPSTSATTSST